MSARWKGIELRRSECPLCLTLPNLATSHVFKLHHRGGQERRVIEKAAYAGSQKRRLKNATRV